MGLVYPEGVYETHLISLQTGELIPATGAHSPSCAQGRVKRAQGGLGNGDSEGHMMSTRRQAHLGAQWTPIWTLAGERRGMGVRDGRSTAPRQIVKDTVFSWHGARQAVGYSLLACEFVRS